jgi:V8-like Glu-specific endopeptidase
MQGQTRRAAPTALADRLRRTLQRESALLVESSIGPGDIDIRPAGVEPYARPLRFVCKLLVQAGNGAIYHGTGFLVAPRTVITAGHCVFDHNAGGWARCIWAYPSLEGRSAPCGAFLSRTFETSAGWRDDRDPECDYGAVFLEGDAADGAAIAFRAATDDELTGRRLFINGYPAATRIEGHQADNDLLSLWQGDSPVAALHARLLEYAADTYGGQSGSPVFIKDGAAFVVVGIHTYGGAETNACTRVVPAVATNLARWSRAR